MLESILLAQSAASPSPGIGAIVSLVLFIAASVWLGTIAQKVVERSQFIQGYFQGNRGLGAWTIALTATVTTSFRRWERHGPLRTLLLMWVLRFLYWIGVSPSHLIDWYKAVR